MSDIKDFKKIADESMFDINVTEEMKNKVLEKCNEKQRTRMPVLKLAAVAACGVVVVGVLHFTGALKPVPPDGYQNRTYENQQRGIFSAPNDQEAVPGQSDISIMNEPFAAREWQPDSLEEAERSFGEGFLIPYYIPEGYKQIGIYASGTESGTVKIIINYSADEQFFAIVEQKTEEVRESSGFEAVDINGTEGYVMSDNAGTITYTQLYWSDDGVMYTISGAMTKEEAVRIARSMKQAGQK